MAEWDCQGDNRTIPEALRQAEYAKLTPEKRKAAEANDEHIRGRPNAEDLDNAWAFARSLVKHA